MDQRTGATPRRGVLFLGRDGGRQPGNAVSLSTLTCSGTPAASSWPTLASIPARSRPTSATSTSGIRCATPSSRRCDSRLEKSSSCPKNLPDHPSCENRGEYRATDCKKISPFFCKKISDHHFLKPRKNIRVRRCNRTRLMGPYSCRGIGGRARGKEAPTTDQIELTESQQFAVACRFDQANRLSFDAFVC
jgi:hypothetical protein